MKAKRFTLLLGGLTLFVACAEEIPPRTTSEFLEDPILLEATMVRCARDRSRTKYEVECVNAREAVNHMAAVEEKARQEAFERQSERKRQALRRTQRAAAEARRRAAEAQRRRAEAAYLAQFEGDTETGVPVQGTVPPEARANTAANAPGAVVPPAPSDAASVPAETDTSEPQAAGTAQTGNDLASIREELKRRQDDAQN